MRFSSDQSYRTAARYRPQGGATGPQAARAWAASAARRSFSLHLPSPTGLGGPTIERTWLWRKERALAVISMVSPRRITSNEFNVLTAEGAWHSVDRKGVKSWGPKRHRGGR